MTNLNRYNSTKTTKFSIRKFKVGVASAVIAAFFMMAGVTVSADSSSSDVIDTVVLESSEQAGTLQGEENISNPNLATVDENDDALITTQESSPIEIVVETQPQTTDEVTLTSDEINSGTVTTYSEENSQEIAALGEGVTVSEENVGKSATGFVGEMVEQFKSEDSQIEGQVWLAIGGGNTSKQKQDLINLLGGVDVPTENQVTVNKATYKKWLSETEYDKYSDYNPVTSASVEFLEEGSGVKVDILTPERIQLTEGAYRMAAVESGMTDVHIKIATVSGSATKPSVGTSALSGVYEIFERVTKINPDYKKGNRILDDALKNPDNYLPSPQPTNLVDTDGDGLPDVWEEEGFSIIVDGKEYQIPALKYFGADVNTPDIFVEVDTMEGVKNKLGEKEFKYLFDQFKDHGIHLHIDAGPDSMNFALGKKWGDIDVKWLQADDKVLNASQGRLIENSRINLEKSYQDWFSKLQEVFDQSRLPVFRHALIINDKFDENRSSGIASNLPGSAFIVWADAFSGKESAMGTFMHELGHTLGLYHGGNDHIRFKPNYLSVMNYWYQTTGLISYDKKNRYNYSEFVLPSLNEHNLDESKGIGLQTNDVIGGIKFQVTNKSDFWYLVQNAKWKKETIEIFNEISSIDWNRNSVIETGVTADISPETNGFIPASINDWERIVFKGGLIGGYGLTYEDLKQELEDGFGKEEIQELSVDELKELSKVGNKGDIVIQPLTYDLEAGNNHTISLNVINLYPEDTTFTMTLTSDKWSTPQVYQLQAKGDEGIMTYNTLEITLDVPLFAGELEIAYHIKQENGEEYDFTHVLEVHGEQIQETLTSSYTYTAVYYDVVNQKELGKAGYRLEIVKDASDLQKELSRIYYNLEGDVISESDIIDVTKPISFVGYEFVETVGDGNGTALSGAVIVTHHYKPVNVKEQLNFVPIKDEDNKQGTTLVQIKQGANSQISQSKTTGESLPNTGDATTILGHLGLVIGALGMYGLKRRQR